MRPPLRAPAPIDDLHLGEGRDGDQLVAQEEAVAVLRLRRPPEVVRLQKRPRGLALDDARLRLPREDPPRRRRADARQQPRPHDVPARPPDVLVQVDDLAAGRRASVRQPRRRPGVQAVLEALRRRQQPQRQRRLVVPVAEVQRGRARVRRWVASPADAVRREKGRHLVHVGRPQDEPPPWNAARWHERQARRDQQPDQGAHRHEALAKLHAHHQTRTSAARAAPRTAARATTLGDHHHHRAFISRRSVRRARTQELVA